MFSVLLRTIIIYIAVVFAMRLMGKRQLGELQPAELVTTFLISNLASICIEEPDLPLLASLVPIFLIAALEILNSTAAWFLPRYAELLFGKPVTVIQQGKVLQAALTHLRMTGTDLAETLRAKDIFDPRTVFWGVIEPNGSLSTASMPEDGQPAPMLPLVIDGAVYQENLELLKLSDRWLADTLRQAGLRQKDILAFFHNGRDALLIPCDKAKKGKKAAP